MEFKEFFSMMKNRISDGADVPYFFKDLIAMITDVTEDEWGTPKDPSTKLSKEGTLRSYAKRGLSQKFAQSIVYRLKPEMFKASLKTRPDAVRQLLADDFKTYDSTADENNIGAKLADVFVDIIRRAAGIVEPTELEKQKLQQVELDLKSKYGDYLINEEKSGATLEKYIRDIYAFLSWLCGRGVDKRTVLEYKAYLVENYKPASVNSVISSLNSFFSYNEWYDCKVKSLKVQKQIFASKEKELSKAEYERLLDAARSKKDERLYLLMQTICSTGIRVSEVRYITVEAAKQGRAEIALKGKIRTILRPPSCAANC